jgi:hypothetical protein
MFDFHRNVLRKFKEMVIPMRIWLFVQLIITGVVLFGSYILIEPFSMQLDPVDYRIPAQSDWVDYGKIFEAGELGEWDYQLYGGFTNSIVKRDGIFYLYYQGASGYRTTPDETVTWRAIGVATSADGINFAKSGKNPVITWFPNDNGEEGAVSAGTALDDQGNIIMHYGANTEVSASLINADVRAAVSQNGLDFVDMGAVIKHDDPNIWGSRDEIFPIISIYDQDRWVVYYLPNGIVQSGWLGAAWGDQYDHFTHSSRTRAGFLPVKGWGTGSYAEIAPDKYALFINNIREGTVQVHLMSLNNPANLSAPVETYRFGEVLQASIYLDKEAQTWFMFYRGIDYYGVKIAPANDKDQTPPSVPNGVRAKAISDSRAILAWKPAEDSETGVAVYKIYRDGEKIATVKGWRYEDSGLSELTSYNYKLQAVNYHGVESPLSQVISMTTLADKSIPRITSVSGFQEQVIVTFSEPLAVSSAINPSNYSITNGVKILKAALEVGGNKVTLTTKGHKPSIPYTLRVENIEDRAKTPNKLKSASIDYTSSSIPGLVGEWSFDEGEGVTATDRSNYGNDGYLQSTNKPGPAWVNGVRGSALRFDGLDDQVWISMASPMLEALNADYSIALWVKPANKPKNDSPNNEFSSIFSVANMGLAYTSDRRYTATIRLENGEKAVVSSDVYNPQEWHHLVMTVDRSAGHLRLYVDGKEAPRSPATIQTSPITIVSEPIFLGTSDPLEGRYENRLNGVIDQVKIFSTVISAIDISALNQDERLFRNFCNSSQIWGITTGIPNEPDERP